MICLGSAHGSIPSLSSLCPADANGKQTRAGQQEKRRRPIARPTSSVTLNEFDDFVGAMFLSRLREKSMSSHG
ncbi:hypothetical protein C5Y97_14635 [Blastopirellula marina]|uniref:Uncharacterized protein n=1 Tax=Blastopirellula marina TaxID=124 RepID=A0A2S8FSM3_9BACT|nr:hypothetical protein C5Y98_14625 [Blastopirellula marina]PTL43930.1 hypothetical protein C5Y97_14635 [Blastopirellula marina]